MAPAARRPLHLGFIGQGTVSAKSMAALLEDLVESAGGKAKFIVPATSTHWTDAIEAVADFALENSIPLAIITDDTTMEVKGLKPYTQQASEKLKAADATTKLVDHVEAGQGKLIMLWDDEDEACYTALERAEKKGIEALDLCAGLHKLEFSGDEASDGESDAPAEGDTDDLDEMDEEALQELADSLDIDVEAVETWDEVRDLIREARAQDGEDESGSDIPTVAELEDWEFAQLKEFAQANSIEVPPRSKTFGYRKAITEWIEGETDDTELPPDDDDDTSVPDDDEEFPAQIGEFDFSEIQETIQKEMESLRNDISSLGTLIGTMGQDFTEKFDTLMGAMTPKSPPQRSAAALKGQQEQAASKARPTQRSTPAPQKAAAAKKVTRPMKKAAPVEKPAERPLDPFMHLLGKKLTRAQAREIMVINAQKKRGRPTEDERALVAQAKEIVPQV